MLFQENVVETISFGIYKRKMHSRTLV